jgi:hypothetical protein
MGTVLKISEKTARKLYKDSSNEFKIICEETFGKEFFSKEITDRVKSYEDACIETGEIPVNESKMVEIGFTQDEIAYRKIKTVTKALNEGWEADWKDKDQSKWFPWFYLSSDGFVSRDASYSCLSVYGGSGSHLSFKSEKLAKYAGTQFTDLYKSFIL